MAIKQIRQIIDEYGIKFVDLRFTDFTRDRHVSVPVSQIDEDFFRYGKMFDGSSIPGFRAIHQSDMVLMPDPATAVLDPFFHDPTLIIRCDVLDPLTMTGYSRDPRSLAKRAQEYLKSTGIADECFFGPEPEFFIFDDVRYKATMQSCGYEINSLEGAWNSGEVVEGGNTGHRPPVKGGYFPLPPVDSSQDLRSAICLTLEKMGLTVEVHHHEVATANQNEITTRFNSLLQKADELQTSKYVVTNTVHRAGKTATFMPKPLMSDNGSGMHCHQSLSLEGINLFAGEGYASLSQLGLHYIGGIIKHAKALNAFTNSTTNSYKRLVPGFEAPVLLAYSACNRSAAIRIPHSYNPKGRRIEVRFPDPLSNPYLAFSAMMMAGLDGIKNKIDPGLPIDKDLYELSESELYDIPRVAVNLEDALAGLDRDRAFLLEGGVFSNDIIDAYIKLKESEVGRYNSTVHPLEFELYYSL